jgi:MFS family permease
MKKPQADSQTDQESNPKPSSKLSYALRALRYRNFRLFFAGQLVSLVGTWMQTVAQAWLIYRLTGSSLLLGTVGFMGQIPVFLFSPLGGIVADRYNRHRVVIATQTASMILALTLAWLTLTGRIAVWHVVVLSALLGFVNAFDIPARQSFIVDMVGKEDLMNAIALNSSMFNSARMIGPAIAGVLVARIGEGWCFFANGVSYLAVIAGLIMIRLTPAQRQVHRDSPLANILEGVRFARNSSAIRSLLLLLGLSSLVGTPYSVLMPIFAGEILHGGPRGLGILMGAAGIGALLGALTLAARSGLRGLGRWVALACGGFGASLVLFAFSRSFWLSVFFLVPTGYALMVQMGSTNTLVQSMTPDHMRGRVMALYSMMFMGMAPFGALLAGGAAHHFGVQATVAAGGLLCITGAIVYSRWLPAFREEARRLILAQRNSRQS